VGSLSGYFRVDVLNVFNWHNYDPGAISVPTDSTQPNYLRATYNKQGNIVGTPLTVKLTAGLKF
jgi:hypothetical protein